MEQATTESATPKEQRPESRRDSIERRMKSVNGAYPPEAMALINDLYHVLQDVEGKLRATSKRSSNRHKAIKGMQTHTAKVIAENTQLKERLTKI